MELIEVLAYDPRKLRSATTTAAIILIMLIIVLLMTALLNRVSFTTSDRAAWYLTFSVAATLVPLVRRAQMRYALASVTETGLEVNGTFIAWDEITHAHEQYSGFRPGSSLQLKIESETIGIILTRTLETDGTAPASREQYWLILDHLPIPVERGSQPDTSV